MLRYLVHNVYLIGYVYLTSYVYQIGHDYLIGDASLPAHCTQKALLHNVKTQASDCISLSPVL